MHDSLKCWSWKGLCIIDWVIFFIERLCHLGLSWVDIRKFWKNSVFFYLIEGKNEIFFAFSGTSEGMLVDRLDTVHSHLKCWSRCLKMHQCFKLIKEIFFGIPHLDQKVVKTYQLISCLKHLKIWYPQHPASLNNEVFQLRLRNICQADEEIK